MKCSIVRVRVTAAMSRLDTHFLLLNDIDLAPNLPGGHVFDAAVIASGVALYRNPFAGDFDGGDHTVRNLVIRAKSPSSRMPAWAGLFGAIDSTAVVRNLKIQAADVQALDRRAGILAGENAGRIINCHADSDIAAGARCSQLGGLVGENQGTILNCSANGSASTQDRCALVGGLVGWNLFSQARVVNSCAVGKISSGTNNSDVGGLVGGNRDGDVKMSFWDIETSGMAASAGGEGLTTAQMQQATPFLEAGWDFVDERANGITDAWRMPADGGYPVLTLGFDGYTSPRLAGEGTAEAPYQIATPDDLGMVWRHDPSACYLLTSSIDLAGIPWQGAPIACFSGLFDGGGCVISHLTLHERGTAGLFGFLGRNARVMDLGIADADIVAPDEAQDLGLLAGKSYFETDVTGCYATGRLSAGRRSVALGGLIGRNQGSVADCYTRADLSCGKESSHVGGVVGYDQGMIQRSYAAGVVVAVDPNATCGGLLGTTATTITKIMMIACYFLAPSEGGRPNNGLGVPLTDARMRQQASFLDWTWKICEGKDYPRLRWKIMDCDRP